MDVEDGAVQDLHHLSVVFVGVFVYLFEVTGLMLAEEVVCESFSCVQEEVPLLHQLVRPHVNSWRVQVVFQSLSY